METPIFDGQIIALEAILGMPLNGPPMTHGLGYHNTDIPRPS